MLYRRRDGNWRRTIGVALVAVLAGVGVAMRFTGEPKEIEVPVDSGRLDYGVTGASSWTPEMQREKEQRLAVEQAERDAERAEIERLVAAGKIEWRKLTAGTGPSRPEDFGWVVVETGAVYVPEGRR